MTRPIDRRKFVGDLAALVVSFGLPAKAHAEQSASPRRIGMLSGAAWSDYLAAAFRQGLLDAGYAEGRGAVIEWRPANGNYDRLPQLATELVQSKVDVIVVGDTPSALAAKRATSTVPIVMVMVSDPVGSGLVASLAHPGGNVTGLSLMTTDLTAKRLQLLKEAIPRLTRVAVLWNPGTPFHRKVIEDFKTAAPALAIELNFVGARTPEEIGPAFSTVNRAHAQALYVIDDTFFFSQRTTLLNLASKARLPLIYASREFTDKGALLFYGASLAQQCRRSAGYVDKILRGANPADLPIEQPTKFELVVNLRSAKALSITIPQSILLQADEVIR